jgi:hypothetical protein
VTQAAQSATSAVAVASATRLVSLTLRSADKTKWSRAPSAGRDDVQYQVPYLASDGCVLDPARAGAINAVRKGIVLHIGDMVVVDRDEKIQMPQASASS